MQLHSKCAIKGIYDYFLSASIAPPYPQHPPSQLAFIVHLSPEFETTSVRFHVISSLSISTHIAVFVESFLFACPCVVITPPNSFCDSICMAI